MDGCRAQLSRGLPISISMLARRSLDVISLSFIGKLGGAAPLAAASLAVSTVSVFALSVFVGLSSATVTLTSQARGAGDSAQAAYWLHRGLLIHGLVAVPITLLLLMLEPSLRLMGQDAELAHAAGEYCMLLLPGMWAWSLAWVVTPWLQSHGIVLPALYISLLVLAMHIGVLLLLFHVAHTGLHGAALASSASQLTNLALLATTVYCLRDRVPLRPLGRASFSRWRDHLKLGLPGVLMLGEWWASEVGA